MPTRPPPAAPKLTRRQRIIVDTVSGLHKYGVHLSHAELGRRCAVSAKTIARELAALADTDPPAVLRVTQVGGSGPSRIVLASCPCRECVAGRRDGGGS